MHCFAFTGSIQFLPVATYRYCPTQQTKHKIYILQYLADLHSSIMVLGVNTFWLKYLQTATRLKVASQTAFIIIRRRTKIDHEGWRWTRGLNGEYLHECNTWGLSEIYLYALPVYLFILYRGFETRWGEFLNLPNPSGRRPWGLLSL
jgi:hypothetical protein